MNSKMKLISALIVVMLSTVVVTPAVCDSVSADEIDYEEEYGVGFLAGYAIGLAVGITIGAALQILSPPMGGAGNADDIDKRFRALESAKVITAMDTAKNLISSILPADSDLWAFTSSYWQRAAEYAVAEYWSMDEDFDANTVLQITGMPQNVANYLFTWSEAIDQAYNNLFDQSVLWNTDPYDGMTLTVKWDGGSISGGSSATDVNKVWMDTSQFATPTSGKNCVYIDNEATDAQSDYYRDIYAFGGTGTLTNIDSGVNYTLNQGKNDIESIYNQTTKVNGKLPSGIYTMSTGVTYAGPLIQTTSDGAAEISGGMVLGQGSTSYYVLSDGDSGVKVYTSSGVLASTSASLSATVTYSGPDGAATDESVIVGTVGSQYYNIIRDYDGLVKQIGHVTSQAIRAAEVMWEIFDVCESSSMYLSPSSIITSIPGQSVSVAESEAIYIQAMKQIATFYKNNQQILDGLEIVTNVESLKLYCYGDIYYNGSLFAENVVYTPYITTTGQSLTLGSNDWSGSGFAMIWAQVDNYSDWDGTASLNSYGLMDLSSSHTMDIEKIVDEGKSKSEVNLSLHVIQKYNTGSDKPVEPPDVPKVADLKTLIIIIIVELAVILFLLGWITGIRLLWLAALIVLIVGVAFSGQISTLLLR